MAAARLLASLVGALVAYLVAVRLAPAAAGVFDPFLLLTVRWAMGGDPLAGQLVGLAAGLTHDALGGGPFGLHGFADTAVGYMVARGMRRLLLSQRGTLALLFAVAAAAQQAQVAVLVLLLLPEPTLPAWRTAVSEVVVTALLGIAWITLEGWARRRWTAWERAWRSKLRMG